MTVSVAPRAGALVVLFVCNVALLGLVPPDALAPAALLGLASLAGIAPLLARATSARLALVLAVATASWLFVVALPLADVPADLPEGVRRALEVEILALRLALRVHATAVLSCGLLVACVLCADARSPRTSGWRRAAPWVILVLYVAGQASRAPSHAALLWPSGLSVAVMAYLIVSGSRRASYDLPAWAPWLLLAAVEAGVSVAYELDRVRDLADLAVRAGRPEERLALFPPTGSPAALGRVLMWVVPAAGTALMATPGSGAAARPWPLCAWAAGVAATHTHALLTARSALLGHPQ